MPHWKNKWQASQQLADNWDNYVRMVARHESVHKDYAIDMVRDLDKRLGELGVLGSCEELQKEVKKAKEQAVAKNKANNRWFDAKDRVYQKKLKWF